MEWYQVAQELGFIPVPMNGKRPYRPNWQNMSLESSDKAMKKLRYNENVGIITGIRSGIFVIDVEQEDLDIWKEFMKSKNMPKTLTIETGGGGRHYYFNYPEELDIKNSVRKSFPGGTFDVRATGGCATWVGSRHPETKRKYELIGGYEDSEEGMIITIANPPKWLLKILL